jgi:hypothetical protein
MALFVIKPSLLLERDNLKILELLQRIVTGMRNGREDARFDDTAVIAAEYLWKRDGSEFPKDKNFVIDPSPEAQQLQREDFVTPLNHRLLTIHDVRSILSSLILEANKDPKFASQIKSLLPEQQATLNIIYTYLLNEPPAHKRLFEYASELLEIFEALSEVKVVDEVEKITTVKKLPLFLQETVNKSAFGSRSAISEALKLFATKNKVGDIGIILKDDERIDAPFLRNFFNEWLHKLYQEERTTPAGDTWKLPPENNAILFQSLEEAVRTATLRKDDKLVKEDFKAIEFFEEVIKRLSQTSTTPTAAGAATSTGDGDSGGGEDQPLEEKLKDEKLKPEERDELIEKLSKVGVRYRDEALRFRTIALRQFFRIHDIDPDILQGYLNETDFANVTSDRYRQIERELAIEIEKVFHSLDPKDIEQLNTPEGRLHFLRLLYGRLSTNPQFITQVQIIAQAYEVKKFTAGEEAPHLAQKQKAAQDVTAALKDDLEKHGNEWNELEALNDLKEAAEFKTLKTLREQDLSAILTYFGINDSEQQNTILQSVEILAFMRLSPDRLTRLNKNQFAAVFNISTSSLDGLDYNKYDQLRNILSEYYLVHRQRLADALGKDSLAFSIDSDLDPFTVFSDADIKKINDIRNRFAGGRLQNSNLQVRHFVQAASYTPDEISQIGADQDQNEIALAYQLLLQQRAEEFAAILFAAGLDADQQGELARQTGIRKGKDGYSLRNISAHFARQKSSLYDQESGIITENGVNQPQVGSSPFNKKVQSSLTQKIAGEGASALGSAVLSGTGIGLLLPKKIRQAVGMGAVVGAVGSLISAVMGGIIPIIGFAVGGILFGPLGAIAGTIGGFALKSFLENLSSQAASASALPSEAQADKVLGSSSISSIQPVVLAKSVGIYIAGLTVIMALPILTAFAILTGAFLPPDPSAVNESKTETSKYLTIEKKALPAAIENAEASNPTSVTYTIEIKAKGDYQITPNLAEIKDDLTIRGGNAQDFSYVADHAKVLEDIKKQLGTGPYSISNPPPIIRYTIPLYGKDMLVTNTFTLGFTVNNVQEPQTIRSKAIVRIGNAPTDTEGCFSFESGGFVFPNNTHKDRVTSADWNEADKNRILEAFGKRAGTSKMYSDLLCGSGTPLKLYRLPGSQFGGWSPMTLGGDGMGLYNLAFISSYATEYTLLHELGHIIDYRNPGLRQRFNTIRNGSCYSYPAGPRNPCNESEAFAEASALYVVYNYFPYKAFKNLREYAWMRDNMYGGSTFDDAQP